jgi:hypothetical protein
MIAGYTYEKLDEIISQMKRGRKRIIKGHIIERMTGKASSPARWVGKPFDGFKFHGGSKFP